MLTNFQISKTKKRKEPPAQDEEERPPLKKVVIDAIFWLGFADAFEGQNECCCSTGESSIFGVFPILIRAPRCRGIAQLKIARNLSQTVLQAPKSRNSIVNGAH